MKVTFFSSFMTHHQKPFSDEMYNILNDQYIFISTAKMPEERKILGYKEENKSQLPYLIELSLDDFAQRRKITKNSDLVIIGSAPIEFIKERLDNNQLTFFYSERLFKCFRSLVVMIVKRLIIQVYFLPSRKNNVYMLCASAYTAWDLKRICAYKNKTYKWGYFTELIEYEIDELMAKKKIGELRLLWVGRFLKWKHAEAAINIAIRLRKNGYKFSLDIIGNGEMNNSLKSLVVKNNLNDIVSFLGSMKPEDVRTNMEKANIFMITSDFNEGWGAVLNEAMNSGCAVVASHAIGSAPYLIKDGENGLIYKNGDINSLFDKVRILINDSKLREQLGINAYKTISEVWNPKVAAERLLILAEDVNKHGVCQRYIDGPCSKAEIIRNNWYRK